MAEVRLRSTESLSKEKAQLFDWQQESSSIPYYQQGNRKYESAGIIEQRNKIKHTAPVREAINRFWDLLPKDSTGRIQKPYYIELCLRFSKLLLPNFSKEESIAVIEEDWENDSESCGSMNYSQFYNALFQLADIWTEEISPNSYSDFLLKIFRRITCKKFVNKDGKIEEILPSIQLVFPEELQLENDWERAESDEDYDSDFEYNYEVDTEGGRKRTKRLKNTDMIPDSTGLHYDEVIMPEWDVAVNGQSLALAPVSDIVPLGHLAEEYLTSLSKKTGHMFFETNKLMQSSTLDKRFVIISDQVKHKIKTQLSSSFVSLKKSIVKVDQTRITSAKPMNRKTVHDFSLSLLKSETKDMPISIEHMETNTIQDLRKSLLQNKYQPVIKRLERRVSLQVRKGLIEVERDKKKVIPEEPEKFLDPIESLRTLYSAETELPKDPYVNIHDIISEANEQVMKILIIGPPRSGKTTLAGELSKALDLNHIEFSSLILKLLAKGKKEDDDQIDDEDEKKPEIYSPFEKNIVEALMNGDSVAPEQFFNLISTELSSDSSKSKGFILDIPLMNPYLDIIHSLKFTFIVNLKFTKEDLMIRTHEMKWDPTTNLVYSQWHIAELLKPVPKKDDEEEQQEEEGPKIVVGNLINRAEDDIHHYGSSINDYFEVFEPVLGQIPKSMPPSCKVEIKGGGISPNDLKEIVLAKLGFKIAKPPAPKKLESESNPKSLLLQEVEENQEPRAWSIWKQIDPVGLEETKLVQGKADYGAEYAGNVFVFDSEENQEKFLKNPQKFLKAPPHMPEEFRLCIIGPRKSGKHTQAEYLCAKYGWKLIDIDEMLKQSMQIQKRNLKDPKPSHPDTGLVQVPDPDFRKILSGESLPSNTILPIILNRLNISLQKRPPPPPTPKSEEEGAEEAEEIKETDQNEKSEEEEEEKQGPPIEEAKVEDEGNTEDKPQEDEVPIEREPTPPPPPIVYEDLPLTEIVLKSGENGNPRLQGFVMIGYPFTEEEANALKEFNVEFDKILYFVDQNEGETLIKRGVENLVDLTKDLAAVDQAVNVCKDAFGEENVIEIAINGTEDEIHDKICRALDPFYVYVDDPDLVVSKEEAGEEGIVSTLSEYGTYDPVVLKEHSWLMPGAEENEVQSLGKRFLFVNEAEMEKFKKDPKEYIVSGPIQVPEPHLMVTGPRGSGVKTVINELCVKYRIDMLELKQTYLKLLDEEKMCRRKARLLKRGFVPRETNEDDEPYDPLLHDPDITEEDESFDRATHEREMMQKILQGKDPLIINSNWFEIEDDKVSQSLVDLLYESRRLPEVVIILRANEAVTLDRLLDKNGITEKYQELMEIRRKEKERAKEEARREKQQARMERIAAGEEVEDEVEEEEEEEEAEDPDAPNLESMLDEAKQKLIEIRDSDNSAIDEIKESFESKNIRVVEVPTEIPINRLMQKINFELSKVFTDRESLLERTLPIKLKPTKAEELLRKNKAKLSCFNELCPVTPELPICKDYPVLFRDRVYYPGSPTDQEKFAINPWVYLSQDTQPKDVDLTVLASIIGGPASGKSTLAKDLAKEIGVVRVNLRAAVQDILKLDSELAHIVKQQIGSGHDLSEGLAVDVITWRLGLSDVLRKGCILDGFPYSSAQAVALANRGYIPSPVFLISCNPNSQMKRFKNKFKYEPNSLKIQMTKGQNNINEVAAWYQNTYDNVRYLTSEHSKWWVKDTAVTFINKVFTAKRNYAIATIKNKPVAIRHLPITRHEISRRFGKFKKYDPILWKFRGELKDIKTDDFLVEYKTLLYAFDNEENMKVFIENPDKILQTRALPENLPRKLVLSECGDIYESRIELEANCLVTLAEQGKLVKGNPTILAAYGDKIYSFQSSALRDKFMRKPSRYEKTKLPVKIPPKADSMVNFVLEEFESSVGFLDQMLGQVIIRALLEVGTLKLKFPNLTTKESALKHFCLFIKANNPNNSGYQKDKFLKKLWDFKQQCYMQQELYEEGVRKESGELRTWEVENYLEKGERYDEFIRELCKNVDGYIDKFFS